MDYTGRPFNHVLLVGGGDIVKLIIQYNRWHILLICAVLIHGNVSYFLILGKKIWHCFSEYESYCLKMENNVNEEDFPVYNVLSLLY